MFLAHLIIVLIVPGRGGRCGVLTLTTCHLLWARESGSGADSIGIKIYLYIVSKAKLNGFVETLQIPTKAAEIMSA